jgi:hypothetical protein
MRRVRAPICDDEAVHLTVVGSLTFWNWAIGKELTEELPTVNLYDSYVKAARIVLGAH